MQRLLTDKEGEDPPFAPPCLKAGDLIIGQAADILLYLGAHRGLAPADEAGCLWAHQLQLKLPISSTKPWTRTIRLRVAFITRTSAAKRAPALPTF